MVPIKDIHNSKCYTYCVPEFDKKDEKYLKISLNGCILELYCLMCFEETITGVYVCMCLPVTAYLILGTVKSDGSLEIFTI